MFKECIRSTPFTSIAADSFFSRKVASHNTFSDDVSFASTLRALATPRLEDNETLYLRFTRSAFSADAMESTSMETIINAITGSDNYFNTVTNTLTIHNFANYGNEDGRACFDQFNNRFANAYRGWQRIDRVTDYFRGKNEGKSGITVSCFINPTLKSTIVLGVALDLRRVHLLQIGIPVYLPWLFSEEITPEERALLETFKNNDKNAYLECLRGFAEQFDFRTEQIRKELAGFEKTKLTEECNNIQNNIDSLIDDNNRLNERISANIKAKRDYEIRILGMKAKMAECEESDSDLMEYFLCNKNLYLRSVTGLNIEFCVKGDLTYFDEDITEALINNPASYIYTSGDYSREDNIPADDMRRLMNAIFIDKTLKLQMCAAFKLEPGGVSVYGSSYRYGDDFYDCIPNPHYYVNHCLGDNRAEINDRLTDNDYIGAIAQCVSATCSLNTAESPTMRPFMSYLYGDDTTVNTRCIRLPDGKVVSPKEAIEFLKKEEADG